MYTSAVRRLLSSLISTSRTGIRSSRAGLLSDLKLLLILTTYLDPDTLWEASYLAGRRFITSVNSLGVAVLTLENYFQGSKPNMAAHESFRKVNPLTNLPDSPVIYADAIESLIKEYPRRDIEDTRAQVPVLTRQIISSLTAIAESVAVLRAVPGTQFSLNNLAFRDKIRTWVDETLLVTSNLEAIEALGAIQELLSMSQVIQGTVTEKYSGAVTVGGVGTVTQDLEPYVFAVPAGTTVDWRNDPTAGLTTWAVPASTGISIPLGVGRDAAGTITSDSWEIVAGPLGNDAFLARVNNSAYSFALTPGVGITTANLALDINAGLVGSGIEAVATGPALTLQTEVGQGSAGMQINFPAGFSFNDSTEAVAGWYQGAYASLTGGPTIVEELTPRHEGAALAATLLGGGTVQLAVASAEIVAGDVIVVEYAPSTANTPLSAMYKVDTIAGGGTLITPSAGIMPVTFASMGNIPTTVLVTAEPVTIRAYEARVYIEETSYLETTAEPTIGTSAFTQYAEATTVTLGGDETVPLRVGDILTDSSAYTITGLSPVTIEGGYPGDTTTATITSGLAEQYGSLAFPTDLTSKITYGNLLELLEEYRASYTWAGFVAFNAEMTPFYDAAGALKTTLESKTFNILRLPRIISLLRQHDFGRSADTLMKGDFYSFLPQSVVAASSASSVLAQLQQILSSL